MARQIITKEKIIDAALFCAFDKGMGETSLNDISNYLSIKKASLYNHFSSKEEMLSSLYTYCSDYYSRVNLISDEQMELAATAPEKTFKAAAVDFIKRHEQEPVFQIYTFINSEKFFKKEVMSIFAEQIVKIGTQCELFLKMTAKNSGMDGSSVKKEAKYFCAGLYAMLDSYLCARKETIRQNPECGIGSLFALPSDDTLLQEISRYAGFVITKFIKKD